jgi:hypothetical protein
MALAKFPLFILVVDARIVTITSAIAKDRRVALA